MLTPNKPSRRAYNLRLRFQPVDYPLGIEHRFAQQAINVLQLANLFLMSGRCKMTQAKPRFANERAKKLSSSYWVPPMMGRMRIAGIFVAVPEAFGLAE